MTGHQSSQETKTNRSTGRNSSSPAGQNTSFSPRPYMMIPWRTDADTWNRNTTMPSACGRPFMRTKCPGRSTATATISYRPISLTPSHSRACPVSRPLNAPSDSRSLTEKDFLHSYRTRISHFTRPSSTNVKRMAWRNCSTASKTSFTSARHGAGPRRRSTGPSSLCISLNSSSACCDTSMLPCERFRRNLSYRA